MIHMPQVAQGACVACDRSGNGQIALWQIGQGTRNRAKDRAESTGHRAKSRAAN